MAFEMPSKKSFLLLLAIGTFTTVFKDNKLQGSHKTVGIKVFLNFFASVGIIRIMNPDTDPGLDAPKKLNDPPDLKHQLLY